jgi:S-adenosylmethionine synthetase
MLPIVSKLDRTGAYMARHVAKSLVANGLTQFCTVALAYAFGEAEPLLVDVQAADPESNRELLTLITDHFDFRLPAITERLNLTKNREPGAPESGVGWYREPACASPHLAPEGRSIDRLVHY